MSLLDQRVGPGHVAPGSTTDRLPVDPVHAFDASLQDAGLARAALWVLRRGDGRGRPLDLPRWHALDTADRGLVARAEGPVLDVGCGPGRITAALHRAGVPVLGLDLSPEAVRLTRQRGAACVQGSVFDRLPGDGAWSTVLLLDGNVGIGGDAAALLRRVRQLLAPDGCLLVELARPGAGREPYGLRLEAPDPGVVSRWFPWVSVAPEHLATVAPTAGLRCDEVWQEARRWFARCSPA